MLESSLASLFLAAYPVGEHQSPLPRLGVCEGCHGHVRDSLQGQVQDACISSTDMRPRVTTMSRTLTLIIRMGC